jgi:hypothetical protein
MKSMNNNVTGKDRTNVSREPDAHVMMRRAKLAVGGLLILSLVATFVTLLFFRQAAYLAAIPIPILFIVYVMVGQFERQARASELRGDDPNQITAHEVDVDVKDAGLFTGLGIGFLLALGAFIVAASLFEWPLIGATATAGFLLLVLINIPYLALFVSEAERDELDKVKGELKQQESDSQAAS